MASASDWDHSKALARVILRDRGQRRKWLGRWLLLTVVWMAAGLWVVDGWLGEDAWKFLAWWGICFALAAVLVVFALYDALSVVREEREKADKN
jgi:peptidoglycan biosynthesis protein MviN/MurJ (putative lipid II flippase)